MVIGNGGVGVSGAIQDKDRRFLYCPMRVILSRQQILYGRSTTDFRGRSGRINDRSSDFPTCARVQPLWVGRQTRTDRPTADGPDRLVRRRAAMKVSHYFEWEEYITGGHAQSVTNQRTIMDRHGIEYTPEPTLDADILHLNNMGPRSIYYARKARNTDVPVVVHTHQTAEDFRESFAFSNALAKPMKPYLRYAYSLADHLVCPSEYNRKVIEEYADAPKTVISNGFDPEKVEGYDDPDLRQT